jgi:hypothetical protein
VPFELGRPLGPPNLPEFQRDVLRSLLSLFEAESGPVLRDYPHEAPSSGRAPDEPWSCVLPLPPLTEAAPKERLKQSFLQEVALLRPWYDEARRAHARTAVGVSGATPDSIDQLAEFMADASKGEARGLPAGVEGPLLAAMRFIADDLKSFYLEAASLQPGASTATAAELNRWLYHDTWLGQALYELRDRLAREAEEQNDPARGQVRLIPVVFQQRPPLP